MKKGVTLIELIIVLLIVGILSSLTYIAFSSQNVLRLDAAARKVAVDLMYVRNLSLSMAKWYGVSFEANPANSYTAYETDGSTDTIIPDPSRGDNFVVNLFQQFGQTKISSINIGAGKKVEFHPLGIPYTDKNGLAITTTGLISLEYAGAYRTVAITPNTGNIEVLP